MASIKQINDKIYALITVLADHHGFDADEALDLVTDGDVNYVEEFHKLLAEKKKAPKKEAPAAAAAVVEETDEVKKVRHNISLWEKKLDAGDFKDRDAHVSKIEKEKKKLQKLLGAEEKPAPAPAPAKAAPAPAPAPAKAAPAPAPVKEVAEKRIKRFSPVMTTQLKKALEDVGAELNDKIKKEFQLYVENLSDDDYRESSLADHMRTFAKTKEEDVPDKVVDVTLKELQNIEMTSTGETPDTFWDADKGRFVKGPEPEDDEDFDEVTFESKKYVVGVKTGRVYEAHDSGDVFAGFKGVGKFKKMKV
jgi:hypothetical protein